MNLLTQAQAIKAAAPQIAHADSEQKNQLLEAIADELIAHTDKILNANEADILAAKAAHKNENRIDRMLLEAYSRHDHRYSPSNRIARSDR